VCDDVGAEEDQQPHSQPMVYLNPGMAVEKHRFSGRAALRQGKPQDET